MFRLDIFARLRLRGYSTVSFTYCNYGTPFEKGSTWLANNPKFSELSAKCQCPLQRRHLRLESCFTKANIPVFEGLQLSFAPLQRDSRDTVASHYLNA
eukprot:s1342_g17.t1